MQQAALDRVESQFADWRRSRTKRGTIPTRLKQQAVALVGQYRKSLIVSRLGINHSMLELWEKSLEREASPLFVELTPNTPTPIKGEIEATLALRGGFEVRLTGRGTDVATLLLTLQQGCSQ
jgi:transposase-like protein